MEKHNDSFRLITLNTWNGEGEYGWRLQLMARELSTLMPDIICLQEVLRTDDEQFDTAGYLADFLHLERIHVPARRKSREVEGFTYESTSGLAVLSSAPITHHWVNQLEPCPGDNDRFALSARIALSAHLITITNVHLTHIADGHAVRLRQLHDVVKSNATMTADTAWFCCGDFNMQVDEPLRRRLGEETGLVIRDCYLDGGGTLPGTTLVNADPAEDKFRIDHILHVHSPESTAARCRKSRLICDKPDFDGCYPSDHFGVCTDIFLPPFSNA